MLSSARVSWVRIAQQACIAGLVGAVVFDAYLWLTTVIPEHGSILVTWQWVASTVLGRIALTSSSYAVAGLAIHVLVSIGWAGGYAYLAAQQPALNRRWMLSGIVYGIIVYVIMQVILLADNNVLPAPNPNAFVNIIVAHTVFFGLPVAYVVRMLKTRAAL